MKRARSDKYPLAPRVKGQVPWFQARLLAWFASHGRSYPWREANRDAYEVLIAEVMLQRTTAASVERVYEAFLARFPSWEAIAAADAERLEEVLEPLGLWRLKAGILVELARAVMERGGHLPVEREELEQYRGVGHYTAGAVRLVAHGHAEPLLDANMARVLERFFGPRQRVDIRHDPYLNALARLVTGGDESLHVNWAILDLGALVCKPGRPLCEACPLLEKCLHGQSCPGEAGGWRGPSRGTRGETSPPARSEKGGGIACGTAGAGSSEELTDEV